MHYKVKRLGAVVKFSCFGEMVSKDVNPPKEVLSYIGRKPGQTEPQAGGQLRRLEANPLAIDQSFVGQKAAFVNHVRRAFDVVAEIKMLDAPSGAELKLLQDRIGSDAVLGDVGIVIRVDRRKTVLAEIADGNRNQLVVESITNLERIQATADKAPDVLFHVDVCVALCQATGSTMFVEQLDSFHVRLQLTDRLLELSVPPLENTSGIAAESVGFDVDADRLTGSAIGAVGLIEKLTGTTIATLKSQVCLQGSDFRERHA